MSDHRRPFAVLLLRIPGKTAIKIEFFNASEWGQEGDLYRLRVAGRWYEPHGVRYLSQAAVGAYLAREMARLGTDQPLDDIPPMPDLPHDSRVRVPPAYSSQGIYEQTWTKGPPILNLAGQWVSLVWMYGAGNVYVPCDELERLKR